MNKILTLALCLTAVGSMSAQKATVDQAKKLTGKIDKVGEARALLKDAMSNPETANDVFTYYVAGNVEFGAFDEAFKKRAINPNDPAINLIDMGNQLVNGYNWYLKAFPLDSVPNEKGQIKPKYSKDMAGKISGHHADYFQYGGELYNNKHYYPEAYNAFMIYGDMPSQPWAAKELKAVPDTTLALAYYYAGIGAFSGDALPDAVKAFKKARQKGITDPQSLIYEIATWQNLMQRDSTLEAQGKAEIESIAKDGYNRFGIKNPLFINSLCQTLVDNEKYDDALALANEQMNKTPDQPFLYALRAWIYDRKGNSDAALADYTKGASYPNADAETLIRASKKLFQRGVDLWNAINGPEPAARANVKDNYWGKAKGLVERALKEDPDNSDAKYILDSIEYNLSL